jgi:predicted DNA-binding transcriptional regulator AlpA
MTASLTSENRRSSMPPRGLSRIEAARYIGVSPSKFDEMVRDGRMPRPKRVDARKVWDIRRLDNAFDDLPDDGPDASGSSNPWEDVSA